MKRHRPHPEIKQTKSRPRGGVWIETAITRNDSGLVAGHAPAGACGLKRLRHRHARRQNLVTPPRGRVD